MGKCTAYTSRSPLCPLLFLAVFLIEIKSVISRPHDECHMPSKVRAEGCFIAARRGSEPPAKRQAKNVDSKQHSRKVIKAIFRRYNVLSSADAEGRNPAFDALLDACEGKHHA